MARPHTDGIEGAGSETLQDAAARRLRELLAGMRMNQKVFGERTGWGRAYVYRRLAGETPLDTSDLDTIQRIIGISATYLIGGVEPRFTPPTESPAIANDDGTSLLPRLDSNQQPFDEWVVSSGPPGRDAEIVPFRRPKRPHRLCPQRRTDPLRRTA